MSGNRNRRSTALGTAGVALLLLFWLGGLAPERVDALLRPYGLFIWFGVLIGAIVLPTVASIRGSKWWLLVSAVSMFTAGRFLIAVMA